MKYKAGDRVRVRKDLEVGEDSNCWTINKKMAKMKGKIVTISKKYDACYRLEEDDYAWTDEILEPVEDIIEYKGKKYDVLGSIEYHNSMDLRIKEHKEEILDEEEKRYLRNVIKYVIEPTHNEIKCIYKSKYYKEDKYCIVFEFNDVMPINLPDFKGKRMYKGMELDREYTLEKLGLN